MKIIKTLVNEIKPEKIGNIKEGFSSKKCSNCWRKAKYAWMEGPDRDSLNQQYGCYYHPGPYTGEFVK